MKKCKYQECGKPLGIQRKGAGRPRKYCSDPCRRAADVKRKKSGTDGRKRYKKQCKKCLICFEAHRSEQKYCSDECRVRKDELPRRYCVVCKKPFPPKNSGQQCCDDKCGKIKGGKTLSKTDYDYPDNYWEMPQREKDNFRQNVNRAERMKTDPKFILNEAFRKGMYQSLRGGKGGRSWLGLVPYTLDELKGHLEKQFEPGMSWFNHGDWHIDHIVPIVAFNFTKPEHEDFKRCWALSNLRPMWARGKGGNLSKGAKLYKHFQPSLAMGV